MKQKYNAKLILSDGSIFRGFSFGSQTSKSGEVVFNTGMVGYPESLTDPSYRGQILVFTYPLIGNYGVPSRDHKIDGIQTYFESDKIHVNGLIVSDYSGDYSHWNASSNLGQWLKEHNIPAIYGIDTRELTKNLREHGVMLGKIVIDKDIEIVDPNTKDLVGEVSIKEPVTYNNTGKKTIIMLDCGVKNNIIREFIKRNIRVIRVPYDSNFFEFDYDGIFISNGPGDPKSCKTTIENLKKALLQDKPIFGICLGNQLLALASGADTYKLKYGHRSQNQPCIEVGTKRCYITSQNHGFAVDNKTLQKGWSQWFINANDGTNEGIIHESGKYFSVQFHPEATPGPKDTDYLFDRFVAKLK
ncbi:glutamine-hydrolyzing carbamoyl-phosphate synthase small subunit [Candidatus Woesearchaeota archaeon]|nr:glutamine-hydrolyzing carbamoyl-phosphate synthase small subunit [Candidatus Woesearchaeota archaeon]